jgi:uncharacterized protein
MLTGPLPELLDHRKMANQAGILEGSVPVQQFTRLREMLESGDGDVHLKLAFSKGDRDRTHVTGVVTARVELICQNCMTQYGQEIGSEVKMDIFPSEERLLAALEAEDSTEQTSDGLVCSGKVIKIVDLVEDELILSVPMIPRHDDKDCPENEYNVAADPVKAPVVEERTT